MFSKEAALLQQIAESRESIRQKHSQLKSSLHDVQKDVSKVFQPIIKPLNKIASDGKEKKAHVSFHSLTPHKNHRKSKLSFSDGEDEMENESEEQASLIFETITGENDSNNNLTEKPEVDDQSKSSFDEKSAAANVQNYLEELDAQGFNNDSNGFGIRKAYGKYMIGDKVVDFRDGKVIVSNQEFPATKGFLELLFKKKVDENLITEKDANRYQKIAPDSHLLRKNFKPNTSFKKKLNHHPKFDTYLWHLNPSNQLEKIDKIGTKTSFIRL